MSTRLLCLVLVSSLAVVLAGCGGGGGSDTPAVTLTIGADTKAALTRAVSLTAPLPAGSTVVVYNFKTGEEITRGTLDATGKCKVKVTPGLTVAVVVKGTLNGKNYRLSLLIPTVPSSEAEYVANPVTSLAAEAIASKYFKKGYAIDQSTLDEVTEAAEDFYSSHSEADYSVGGGIIAGSNFGAKDSLTTVAKDVTEKVPDQPNKVVAAKYAVQQIKDAGTPIKSMLDQEYPDAQSIITEAVIDKYRALASSIGELMGPAIFGELRTNTKVGISVLDLEFGRAYTVVNPQTMLIQQTGTTDANKIRITMTKGGKTLTLVATNSSSSWTLKQTSSADSSMSYIVTITNPESITESNPSATVEITLKDARFPTGVTFSGTVSATGNNPYSKFNFNGNFTSPQLTVNGALEVTFPSSLPAGANPEDLVYEWPKSFSLSNGKIILTGSGKTLSSPGSLSTETAVYTSSSGKIELGLKKLQMTGKYTNNSSKLSFDGSITGEWTNAPTTGQNAKGKLTLHGELSRTGHPAHYADIALALSSGTLTANIDLRVGSNTLEGTGTGKFDYVRNRLSDASLVLTNQDGVKFTFKKTASGISGSIKVGSPEEKVADITESDAGLRIQYTDGTFEDIPL